MDNVGTLESALERFHVLMETMAHNVSRQVFGRVEKDDLYQEFAVILSNVHTKFNALPVIEFTKIFRTSLNNYICNMVSQKRPKNRIKVVSLNSESKNGSTADAGKKKSMLDLLERDEQTDETYKNGILEILNNVSPEAGKAILDSFDPSKRGNSSRGINDAYNEVKKYLGIC